MAISSHISTNPELAGLIGWKYTPLTSIEHDWTHESLMSRGCVYDLNGNYIARPFVKFFNG